MFDLDLGDDLTFKIKSSGKEYTLREPSVAEIDSFRGNAEADGAKVLVRLLTTLGMPEDVVLNMGMSKAKRLVDWMLEELTKKK